MRRPDRPAARLRGEVTVEVRTDDPDVAVRARRRAAHRPGRARARSPIAGVRLRSGGALLLALRRASPTATAAEALRGTVLLVAVVDLPRARGPRRVLRPPAGRARPRVDVDGARARRRSPRSCTRRPQDVLVVRRPDGSASVLVPFVAAIVPTVDLAGRLVVVVDPPPGLLATSPSRREACASTSSRSSRSTSRRCALSLLGKARERGLLDVRRPRPAALDHRPAPHRRRHPVRRRAGHGDAARAVGPAPSTRSPRPRGAARPRLVVPTPAGRPFTQALAARAGRRAAAGLRLRPVRGHRPAGGRLTPPTPDAGRRGLARRLRARRRRGRRRW